MKQRRINKIELRPFINMLIKAHATGADYIDIIIQQGEPNQDAIGINILKEYVNLKRVMPKGDISTMLTTDKLNQLLNNSIN